MYSYCIFNYYGISGRYHNTLLIKLLESAKKLSFKNPMLGLSQRISGECFGVYFIVALEALLFYSHTLWVLRSTPSLWSGDDEVPGTNMTLIHAKY